MAKVKLIYGKREFAIKKESNLPLDYSYSQITDMAIPTEMYRNNIEVVKQKKSDFDEHILVLKSNDTKKVLRCKIMTILGLKFAGKIDIKYFK